MRKFSIFLLPLILLILTQQAPADETSGWPSVYRHGPTSGKYLALTFDDAPMEGLGELLRVLDEIDVRATFFIEGQFAQNRRGMVAEIAARGHELGNHSFSHPDMTTLDENALRDEIYYTNTLIFEETGVMPHLFRPPGGQRNPTVDRIVYENEMTSVMWTVNTADYRVSEAEIKSRILNGANPGGIILMHDGVDATRAILPEIVEILRSRGYEFITLGEMLEISHGECQWSGDGSILPEVIEHGL